MLPSRSKKQNNVLPKTFYHFDSVTKLKVKPKFQVFSLTQPPQPNEISLNNTAIKTLRYRSNSEVELPPMSSDRSSMKNLDKFSQLVQDKLLSGHQKFGITTDKSWRTQKQMEAETNPPYTDRPNTEGISSPLRFEAKQRISNKFLVSSLAKTDSFRKNFYGSHLRSTGENNKSMGISNYSDFYSGERNQDGNPKDEIAESPPKPHVSSAKLEKKLTLFRKKPTQMSERENIFIAHLKNLEKFPAEIFRERGLKVSSSNEQSKSKNLKHNLSHRSSALRGVINFQRQDSAANIENNRYEIDQSMHVGEQEMDNEESSENNEKGANLAKFFRRHNNINLSLKKRFLTKKFSIIEKNTNQFLDNVNDLAEDFCKNFNEYKLHGSSKRLYRVLSKELEGFDSHFREALININENSVVMPMFPEYLILKMQTERWDPDPEEYTKSDNKVKYLQGYINFVGAIDPKKMEKLARINGILTEHIIQLRKRNTRMIGSSIVDLEKKLAQKHLNQLDSYIYRGLGRHYSNYVKFLMNSNIHSEPFISNLGKEIKLCELKYGELQKIDPRSKSLFKTLDSVSRKIKDMEF